MHELRTCVKTFALNFFKFKICCILNTRILTILLKLDFDPTKIYAFKVLNYLVWPTMRIYFYNVFIKKIEIVCVDFFKANK